jgi:hypothetical protein
MLVTRRVLQVIASVWVQERYQSCIKLSENPVFHDSYKHIDIKYHFLKDRVHKRLVALYVQINQQVADILTKPLAKGKFKTFKKRLGLVENTFLTKRECYIWVSWELSSSHGTHVTDPCAPYSCNISIYSLC